MVTFSHSLSFPVYFFLNWLMFLTRKTLYSDQEACNDSEVREGEGRRVRGMRGTYILALGRYGSPALCLRGWTLMLQASRVVLHLFSTFHLKCPCFNYFIAFQSHWPCPHSSKTCVLFLTEFMNRKELQPRVLLNITQLASELLLSQTHIR